MNIACLLLRTLSGCCAELTIAAALAAIYQHKPCNNNAIVSTTAWFSTCFPGNAGG
jgi:hypothetical protein